MSTFTLIIEILYISFHIPQTTCRSVELVPLPPTKPDISAAKIIESFAVSPSALEMWEYCSTNNSRPVLNTTSGKDEESYRWKEGFFVQPDPAFTEEELLLINSAMHDLQKVLCIDVKLWPPNSKPTGDYAFIRKSYDDQRCYSPVGRQGGKQIINLGTDGCIAKHKLIHECIHTLGFSHEQNRPDRDDYIDIFRENIKPKKEHNFQLAVGSLTYGLPYDYESIMHYSSYAFSIDEKKPTMLKKDGGEIGHNKEISPTDAQKLQAMYNCN